MEKDQIRIFGLGVFTLVEILLVLIIIGAIFYTIFFASSKKNVAGKKTQDFLAEQKIDTRSYQTILDSSKRKINRLNQRLLNNEKQLENLEK
jgi:competence protein ComGC